MMIIENKTYLALWFILTASSDGQLQQCPQKQLSTHFPEKHLQSNYQKTSPLLPIQSYHAIMHQENDMQHFYEDLSQLRSQRVLISSPVRTTRPGLQNKMVANRSDPIELQQQRYRNQEKLFKDTSSVHKSPRSQSTRQKQEEKKRFLTWASQKQRKRRQQNKRNKSQQPFSENPTRSTFQNQKPCVKKHHIVPIQSTAKRLRVSSISNQAKTKSRERKQKQSQYQSLSQKQALQLLSNQQFKMLSNQLRQIKNLVQEVPNNIKNLMSNIAEKDVSNTDSNPSGILNSINSRKVTISSLPDSVIKSYQTISDPFQAPRSNVQENEASIIGQNANIPIATITNHSFVPIVIIANDSTAPIPTIENDSSTLTSTTENASSVPNSANGNDLILSLPISTTANAQSVPMSTTANAQSVPMSNTANGFTSSVPISTTTNTLSFNTNSLLNSNATNYENISDNFKVFKSDIRENETLIAVQNTTNASNLITTNASSFNANNILNLTTKSIQGSSDGFSIFPSEATKHGTSINLQNATRVPDLIVNNDPSFTTNNMFNPATENSKFPPVTDITTSTLTKLEQHQLKMQQVTEEQQGVV